MKNSLTHRAIHSNIFDLIVVKPNNALRLKTKHNAIVFVFVATTVVWILRLHNGNFTFDNLNRIHNQVFANFDILFTIFLRLFRL